MDPEIQEVHTPNLTPPQTPPRTPPKTPARISPALKGVSPGNRISPGLKGARSGRRKVSFADLGQAALSRNPSEAHRGASHRTGASSSPDKTIILWDSAENSGAFSSGTLRTLGFDTDTSLPDFPAYSPPAKGVWGKMKKMTRRVFGRKKTAKKTTVWSKVRKMARW
ncbi:hypothetical protein BCV69DRAFT_299226 [Microstroma glucosiphilum]|uniref:Uncharacterized protein n=1 Tax=Pseudomicrostroma glucosiphilum TaxID=1684307 RepID=A0A316U7D5_9BASI|nr:hypothetical protein BCV69DRAFT_299226 [Pseudomicrostroma glucosiphilum]PWN20748.1 hypothetical protein BCV69DRAFT_299226 [Pseudomicrostroma glucosiphilum]